MECPKGKYTKSIHKILLLIPVHLQQQITVRQLRNSTEKKKHGRLSNKKPLRGLASLVFAAVYSLTQNHRIIQVRRDSGSLQFKPLPQSGSAVRSEQPAQGFVPSDPENLEGQRLHSLPAQPVLPHSCPNGKKGFGCRVGLGFSPRLLPSCRLSPFKFCPYIPCFNCTCFRVNLHFWYDWKLSFCEGTCRTFHNGSFIFCFTTLLAKIEKPLNFAFKSI